MKSYITGFGSVVLNTAIVGGLATSAIAMQGFNFDPQTLGIDDQYVFNIESGRGTTANIQMGLEDLQLQLVEGIAVLDMSVGFKDLIPEISQFMDMRDFNLARKSRAYVEYHHGDLLRADANADGRGLNTRVMIRARTGHQWLGSNSHNHHFNIAVEPQIYDDGTRVHVIATLGPKDGFPNWAEDAISDALDDFEPHFSLAAELVEAGVRVTNISFQGSAKDNTLVASMRLEAPLIEAMPLLTSDFDWSNAVTRVSAPNSSAAARGGGGGGGNGRIGFGELLGFEVLR